MKKILAVLCVSFLLLCFSSTGGAVVIFEDNFNSESTGLNYNSFANWTVTDGTVDLIGVGTSWNWFPAYGLYVDMDGSTGNAGKITTTTALNLFAGSYNLSFDIAGNQRRNETDTISFGVDLGVLSGTVTAAYLVNFTTISLPFDIVTDGFYDISFEGIGGDNVGLLLDNIRLESVPEPAAMLLIGTGFLGLAVLGRKRFLKK